MPQLGVANEPFLNKPCLSKPCLSEPCLNKPTTVIFDLGEPLLHSTEWFMLFISLLSYVSFS